MKTHLDPKQRFNFKRSCHVIVVMMLLFITTEINLINPVSGQELKEEPIISLEVQDQPLVEVLDILSRDTGYTFKVSSQWKDYSVNASIQNMPLNKGLNRILTGLNHVIIYESEENINILVYGKANLGEKKFYPNKSRSSLIKKFQFAMDDDVSDFDDMDEDEEEASEQD